MNIHQAAFAGNIQRINEILESSPSQVNQILELKDGINTKRVTPIFFAAISGEVKAVTLLLERNAIIQHGEEALELLRWSAYGKDQSKKPPILYALSAQRDIHITQLENLTVEQFKTSYIALKALLSKNNFEHNLETIDTSYYYLAGFKGDIAHLRETMKSNCTPSTLSLIAAGAVSNGKIEVLEFLHKEHPFNLKAEGLTPAYIAAQNGHVKALEYLHNIGVNLENPLPDGPHKGSTAAYTASAHGKVNVLEYLHNIGANLLAPLTDGLHKGSTAAYIAAQSGHVKALEYLHNIGFNLENPLPDGLNKGYTPAFIAAQNGHVKVLEFLYRIGVNLVAPILDGQAKGYTPTFVAAAHGKVNVLEYLHSIGFNLNASLSDSSYKGATPAYVAAQNGHVKVLEFLYRIGVNLVAPLPDGLLKGRTTAFIAAFGGHVNVLEYLQSKEINVRAPLTEGQYKGYTPACIAAQNGQVEVLEFLNRIGDNLAAPLRHGRGKGLTPGYSAFKKGKINVLKFFSNEAKWIEDGFQNLWKTLSPFHLALLMGQPHHVKELIDFESPIAKTINDANDKEWSLIDFIGQAYQEKYISNLENAVAICQILLEGGICKRDELLEVFKITNYDLFEALLASPEKRLLKVLTEKKFLEKILTSRRTVSRKKALLRRDNSGDNLLIQSSDLAHFIKEQIRIIISKDAPLYSPINTEFTELSSTRVAQGYQFEWEPHKLERIVRILEDLERASTEISKMTAKSEAFQNLVPATYTLIDALDLPENGMEVEIPSM